MLPALFSERRLNTLSRTGLSRDAIALSLRAEALLVKAVELEPRLNSANLRLAQLYTARGDHDRAIERYRRVLVKDPNDLVALNNLAYAIAVNKQQPKEALLIGERALAVSQEPLVLDTLAWIHHLLGNDATAAPLIERALAGAGDSVDVLIHAATIHAALKNTARATAELTRAEGLDPEIGKREDVRALRDRLKSP
jgi:tetratricopeptide (TPR) repeat protein